MNVLCFGDSNTLGYDPRGYWGGCYEVPWPKILEALSGWDIRNDGENGREIPKTCVKISEKTDLLIIMLGTNDLLQGNPVVTVSKRMELFLENIHWDREKTCLVAPPPMKLGTWVPTQNLIEASTELAHLYQGLCNNHGILFLNAGEWKISLAYDGVHFTEEGHRVFAEKLYANLQQKMK